MDIPVLRDSVLRDHAAQWSGTEDIKQRMIVWSMVTISSQRSSKVNAVTRPASSDDKNVIADF